MNELTIKKKTSDRTVKRFVVNLLGTKSSDATVRSCEVFGKGFRNRTSFAGSPNLCHVFVKQIAEGLEYCLGKLTRTEEVISLPDFTIQAEGLVLSRPHIMVSIDDGENVSIVIRFAIVYGAVNKAFVDNIGFDYDLPTHTERVAALVLSDLSMQLANICTSLEQDCSIQSAQLECVIKTLTQKSHEVQFQAELLKRFVNSLPAENALIANQGFHQQNGEHPRSYRAAQSTDNLKQMS